jgi:hypothetical protein
MEKFMEDTLLVDYLKNFHAAADTRNFNVLDFISAFGDPLHALAYSKLFWPDFIEFEGMVFLKEQVEDDEDRSKIRAAIAKYPTRKEVEQSFNQFMIPDTFFGAGLGTTNDNENLWLAERMVEMWQSRLAKLFPDRTLIVELELPEHSQEGPTIVVYQA